MEDPLLVGTLCRMALPLASLLLLLVVMMVPTPGNTTVVGGRELCDVACPKTWDPICSTKQVTYVNACFLYKSVMCIGLYDVTEAYRGPCSPCVAGGTCPSYSDPVCGWDGHTYLNLCTFQVSNQCRGNASSSFRHRGTCAPDPSSSSCRSFRQCHVLYMPICGSDGRTYGNTCELDLVNDCRLEVDRVQVEREGPCMNQNIRDLIDNAQRPPCSTVAPGQGGCYDDETVCGSDGRNYGNWRKLQHYNDERMPPFKVDLAYMGLCRPNPYSTSCRPVTTCPHIVEPVCATNGKTYINHCQLFRTNECRQYQNWIHFEHDGSCSLGAGFGKAGLILMKITIILVIFVVFFAVLVPLYYARRSHQLVTSWNTNYTTYSVPSSSGGRYHLVATVGTDMPMVSIIPIGAETPMVTPHPSSTPHLATTVHHSRPSSPTSSASPLPPSHSTAIEPSEGQQAYIKQSLDLSVDELIDQPIDQPLLTNSSDDVRV